MRGRLNSFLFLDHLLGQGTKFGDFSFSVTNPVEVNATNFTHFEICVFIIFLPFLSSGFWSKQAIKCQDLNSMMTLEYFEVTIN